MDVPLVQTDPVPLPVWLRLQSNADARLLCPITRQPLLAPPLFPERKPRPRWLWVSIKVRSVTLPIRFPLTKQKGGKARPRPRGAVPPSDDAVLQQRLEVLVAGGGGAVLLATWQRRVDVHARQ